MKINFTDITVIALVLSIAFASTCSKVTEGSIYDFSSLQNSVSNQYQTDQGKIFWNVCGNYISSTQQNCGKSDTFATYYPNVGQCSYLTGSDSFSSSSFDVLDSNDHSKGISISYSAGQSVNGVSQQLVLKVLCDSSADAIKYQSLTTQNGIYTLTINSKAEQIKNFNNLKLLGCPSVDFSSIWNFLNHNKWISMILLMVIGFFLCFYGLKFIKITLFLTGFTLGFLVCFMIAEAFLKPDTSDSINWTVLGISTLVGLIGAFVAFKIKNIGIFAVGATGGVFLAFLIFNTFHFGDQSKYVLWIEVGLFAIVCGALCLCIKDHILIIASSLVGAYMLVRGISLYAGGFPNEFTVQQQIKNGDWSFPWYYYLYLCSIILLKIGGGWFQYRSRRKRGDSDDRSSNASADDYRRMKHY